ncbi:hypothetical protein MMC09_002202 [Bachmanniomyces sp. S44760]|nr:hypothetical protein [Bachmanniomyces sp. S44760]
MSSSTTPIADAIRSKITQSLAPTHLEVQNDSQQHAHHVAMKGATSRETHFRVTVVSDAFKAKPQPARHRMVYALLKEELDKEGGVHALQLKTQTVDEERRLAEREREEEAQKKGEKIADVEQLS